MTGKNGRNSPGSTEHNSFVLLQCIDAKVSKLHERIEATRTEVLRAVTKNTDRIGRLETGLEVQKAFCAQVQSDKRTFGNRVWDFVKVLMVPVFGAIGGALVYFFKGGSQP